jgi:FkbM family methyltransferase
VGRSDLSGISGTRFHLPPDSTLDRRGLRWFVSLRRTVSISLRRREPCLVRYRDGVPSCRYPGGFVIPFTMPRTPEQLEADTAQTFFRSYTPREGDVVVEAGAGIGTEVLVLARLVGPKGRVISVEAHPASFERLASLCRLNRLRNVTPIHAALLDEPGTALITDDTQSVKNSVVSGDGSIPVSAETLDHLLSRLEVERIDFLKMNIEGAELNALEGFRDGLARTVHMAVACHDHRADKGESSAFRTKSAVRQLLESYGFLVETGTGDDASPWLRDYLYAKAPTQRVVKPASALPSG